MYWNPNGRHHILSMDSWIVTLDVLKSVYDYHNGSSGYRWIVTLDVLKFFMNIDLPEPVLPLNSNIRCIEIQFGVITMSGS